MMRLIIGGFIVHVIFLLSIFDIYFKSPIIDGIEIQENDIQPPAKRLVLIVADGLRADSFFTLENGTVSKSPHLRIILEEKGVWGVCHARVPTESRPGHVALIAGFYEDPSAVFKGWKENPVEFDSVFNKSTVTYSWGSPDILPMFSKGALDGKVNTYTYSAEEEDFSGRNGSASQLNDWVFDKFEEFVENAKTNSTLSETLNKNGVIYFLHLLGTDVVGHVNKPRSREYKELIELVDKGVEKVEKLLKSFYNDNDTVYIFTSDHGMTDWGSHGDGSVSETETPIVVWGAGISGPEQLNLMDSLTPHDWGLSHLSRRDILQADLVPLMAVLLGIPIPVHSLGTLPLPYLGITDKTGAEAMYLNSKQLLSHFRRHRQIIENHSISFLYKPFQGLNIETETAFHNNITELMNRGQYQDAIEDSKILIKLIMQGLKYYQNYYQNLLLLSISSSYIGWIAWLMVQILPHTKLCYKRYNTTGKTGSAHIFIDIVFIMFLISAVSLIYAQMLPVQYYVYCCLPIVLWWAISLKHPIISSVFSYMRGNPSQVFFTLFIYSIGIELLVLTFFYRWVLCVVLCGLGIWPLFEKQLTQKHRGVVILWILTCFGLAIFPTLPTIGSLPNTKLVIISGWLWLIAGLVLIINQVRLFKNKEDCLLLVFQLSLFPLTVWLVSSTAESYESKLGLPLLNQILSWILLIICPFIPFVGSVKVIPRLGAISLSLAVPFLLLSIGHEALFILILMINLFTWVTLEKDISAGKNWDKEIKTSEEYLTKTDFRRSFFFIIYIILSFFGTGNIASINSFDPVWVRCFLTMFSPFTMTILILLKVLVPFLLVSCSFQALNIITKAWTNQLFMMMLIQCDFMGLHFLYAVTNEGSWLQIGTSISHYVIIQGMIMFIVGLYSIANFYMQNSFRYNFNPKTNFLSGQSLESRAVYTAHNQYKNSWSIFDKRHVE